MGLCSHPLSNMLDQIVGNDSECRRGRRGRLTIDHWKKHSYGTFHHWVVRDLSQQRQMPPNILGEKFFERRDVHVGASGKSIEY